MIWLIWTLAATFGGIGFWAHVQTQRGPKI